MEPLSFLIFIILLGLSAFFSSAEIALMSLPSHTIEALIKQKKRGAKTLYKLRSNTDQLLINLLIGSNLVNTIMASLATKMAINIARTSGIEESLAIGIATGIITFLILTFGDVIPKTLGAKYAQSIGLMSAPFLRICMIVLFPVVWLYEKFIQLFTGKHKKLNEISEEEIQSFIEMGKDSGTIDDGEHDRIKGILELADSTVEDVMTPRVNIQALDETTTVQEAIDFYLQHHHSRIPVFRETVDRIYGFVTIRELLSAPSGEHVLADILVHDFMKVPVNQPLDTLFELLQKNRKHIALVIDEYGGVAGVVTLEDIFEEVFGEIRDETDHESDDIQRQDDKSFVIDSSVMIDDILEEFDLELEHIGLDVSEFSTETVSYILTDTLERFPEKGEVIDFDITTPDGAKSSSILRFHIIDMTDNKIGKIQVALCAKIPDTNL